MFFKRFLCFFILFLTSSHLLSMEYQPPRSEVKESGRVNKDQMEDQPLRADEIKESGKWKKIYNDIKEGNNETGEMRIRRIDFFNPSNQKPKPKEVFVVTHGTWGMLSKQYFKDEQFEKKQKQNYRDIKRFASWYSFATKKPVELQSFIWNGELSDEARLNASKYLKSYLEKTCAPNIPVSFISHSHGCNIVNNLTHSLKLPINMVIHLACPMRSREKKYQPKNFKQLIYFHSSGDAIEPLGRITEDRLKLLTGASFVAYPILMNGLLLTKINTSDPISDIKQNILFSSIGAMGQFSVLSFCDYFLFCRADNYFPAQDNASVIGLKTTINNKKPGHSDVLATGHPEIADTLQLLPEILTKIYREYPAHVGQSFDADLNIECNEAGKYTSETPIVINNLRVKKTRYSVLKPATIPYIVNKAHHIKNPDDLKKLQLNEDNKVFGNLDNWFDGAINKPKDFIAQIKDTYGCSVELVQAENNFDADDLERERKKANS